MKYSIKGEHSTTNIHLRVVFGIQAVIWPQIKSYILWNYSFINCYRPISSISLCCALDKNDCKFSGNFQVKDNEWIREINWFVILSISSLVKIKVWYVFKSESSMVWMFYNSSQHVNGTSERNDSLVYIANFPLRISKCKCQIIIVI